MNECREPRFQPHIALYDERMSKLGAEQVFDQGDAPAAQQGRGKHEPDKKREQDKGKRQPFGKRK